MVLTGRWPLTRRLVVGGVSSKTGVNEPERWWWGREEWLFWYMNFTITFSTKSITFELNPLFGFGATFTIPPPPPLPPSCLCFSLSLFLSLSPPLWELKSLHFYNVNWLVPRIQVKYASLKIVTPRSHVCKGTHVSTHNFLGTT